MTHLRWNEKLGKTQQAWLEAIDSIGKGKYRPNCGYTWSTPSRTAELTAGLLARELLNVDDTGLYTISEYGRIILNRTKHKQYDPQFKSYPGYE